MIHPLLPPLQIGSRSVGAGQPCYIIAEAGSNHNGSLEQALVLIDLAAEAGCDAVKFQVFNADKLYPPSAGTSDYLGDERSIFDIIRSMELPDGWLPLLAEHSRKRGLDFLCSAFDEAAVDLVAPWVDAFKCASYEMTHTPLLQHMVRKGKPLIMSTGTATLDEVGEAVAAVRAALPHDHGDKALPLVLLQCTASYPAPMATAHVRVLTTLREAFGVWSGLSDHTREPAAALAAVALGAVVVEKHYTLSNRMPGPDHKFSLEPGELFELVRRIREVETVLGDGAKHVDPVELELRQFARRSVFTTRPLAAGEAFSAANTAVLRHGKHRQGLEPAQWPKLLGHKAARDLPAFAAVQAEDAAHAPELLPSRVTLRRAQLGDMRPVWDWNNDPSTRAVSISVTDIPWEQHVVWFKARLADPTCRMWIVLDAGQPQGIVRVERAASSHGGLVSLAIAPHARGKGVGKQALRAACERYCGETGQRRLEAWILPDNAASLRIFAAAGFDQIGVREIGGRPITVHQRLG